LKEIGSGAILFFLQLITQLKDLDLNLALAIMFKDVLVGLALTVSEKVVVLGVGSGGVARLEMRKVALNVSRSTTSAWCRETDVGRHDECDGWWKGAVQRKRRVKSLARGSKSRAKTSIPSLVHFHVIRLFVLVICRSILRRISHITTRHGGRRTL
jgi:hypothetical protein